MRALTLLTLVAVLGVAPAAAQPVVGEAPRSTAGNLIPQAVLYCLGPGGARYVPCSSANPLPVAGTGGSSTPATAGLTTTRSASLVAKAAPGVLLGFSFTQGAAVTSGFLAVVDSATAPASGATITPRECVPVAQGAYFRARQQVGDRYDAGIVLLSTTSCETYTPATPTLMTAAVQ